MDISELKFDENGLIPAIISDAQTDEVLMLAYMNEESLQISINEGKTCFWSRSRNKLWRKGETSGSVQRIISIKTDCDKDALLISVAQSGPACHTGEKTCFFNDVIIRESSGIADTETKTHFTLANLYDIIKDRKINPKPGSYTTYLFDKGKDKILKKIGEESTEVIIAGKSGDKTEAIYEIADLVYHAMVLMTEMDIAPDDILNELESRFNKK